MLTVSSKFGALSHGDMRILQLAQPTRLTIGRYMCREFLHLRYSRAGMHTNMWKLLFKNMTLSQYSPLWLRTC